MFAGLILLQVLTTAKPDLGLRVGNVWTYSVVDANGEESLLKETAVRNVNVTKGVWALEIKVVEGSDDSDYRYLGQSENGLLRYYNSSLGGPGVSAETAPSVLLWLPFKKGTTWKWVEKWRGQTLGEVDEKELRKLDEDVTAVIVDGHETVEVPAGRYTAVHVRVTADSVASGRRFEDNWYVFGVGLVKSVKKSRAGQYARVLTRFEQGQ